MTRVGFLLSGCGYLDGSEIQEAVVAMLCLEEAGAVVLPLSLASPQREVVDHVSGNPVESLAGKTGGGTRSVLEESARIVRGKVRDLAAVDASELDAVVIPGGYGVAKNLCDFAVKGAAMQVEPATEKLLRAVHAAGKPIGAICIAPVLLAKLFGNEKPRLTIGNDAGTAAAVEQLGARHVTCAVSDCVVDREHRFVTTPAYMLAETVRDIHQGIRKLADAVVQMSQEGKAAR